MDERTRAYLRGRFGDHYRRTELSLPPAASEREWGYIPYTRSSGTTMVRHHALLDIGDVGEFLARERPRHVYFSAGRYDDPAAGTMGEKGWRGADLVFDLDADHLPRVDPEADSYADMLATCKDALLRLLDFLDRDFGFEDTTVVFSGGRGYHVHVRDPGVQDLGRDHRREVVDYIRGHGITELTDVFETETVAGLGLKNPTEKKHLPTDGGWGRRVHDHLLDWADEVRAMDDDDAVDYLRSYDGIGETRAETILSTLRDQYDTLAAGNVEPLGSAIKKVCGMAFETALREDPAPIDEPVTTDVNRLIRLPGSLHGGTGLVVTRIDRGDLVDFDPLVDAVPSTFAGREIRVRVTDPGPVELGGDSLKIPAGAQTVPEPVGVFLMARVRAEKAAEPNL